MKKYCLPAALILFFVIIGYWTFSIIQELRGATRTASNELREEEPVVKYGLNLNDFKVISHIVRPNELFADIFLRYNVTDRKSVV